VPISQADLARLGIVDPNTGAPLPGGAQPEGYQQGTVDQWAEASDERATAAEQVLGDGGPAPESADYWKQKATDAEKVIQQNTPTVADTLTAQQQQHNAWAAEAWNLAVSRGMDPKVAEVVIRSEKEKLDAQAELAAHRHAALPLVRRGAADEIAAEFSDKKSGIVINPDELGSLGSMEAMRQTATVLKKEREKHTRDGAYAARLTSGVDRAEGVPMQNGKARVPDGVSPTSRIAYGLERGHL
jgi:hypothetical protein